MKRFLALLVAMVMIICTLAACGMNTPSTDKPNDEFQTTDNKNSKLYPLSTEESLYSTYSDIPEIIFSTTGAENGLSGTIYSFSGKMIGELPKLSSSYFVVETKYGEVLMMNVYNELKGNMPVDEKSYATPEIGEEARFTCIYDGFSSKVEMPAFTYGNDAFLLSTYLDGTTETPPPAHTHSFSNATCTKAPTCTCGETSGKALGHSFSQGKCSRCGDIDPNYNPVSTSKQNALKEAKSYLNYSAFSYLGLIEQLEYEKFSREDAVYGADNCGANWNEQALKSAKSYLNFSAFSYLGLIEQLEYEKFTTEQAKYGADNCGADWNEQAAKKAESYLKSSSFSRERLIDQLEYSGFTHEQAVYGANYVGL